METQTYKSLLKTGVLELGLLTASLLVFGHCQGVIHATSNQTPIDALQRGDNESLRSMLNQGADPNAKDGAGTPLLMHAVLYSDAEAVRLLLNNGADPNASNAAGATALIWAAADPEKAQLLMKYGADVNARSVLGRTPLLVAAASDGAGKVVHQLLKSGARTDVRDELKGNPRLMTGGGGAPAIVEAAKARDGVALRALLKDPHVDVNAKDANGGTALTEAIILGNTENAYLLLDRGADVNVPVSMAVYTPLILASMRNDDRMVARLIDAGAAVNDVDSSGTTALMWAAYVSEDKPSATIDTLLRAGADPSIQNRKGETALTLARWHGKTHAAQQLAHHNH